MQVQPIVLVQLAGQHLRIPKHLVVDPRIGERQGDRVVPRQGVGWRVDRYLGRFLQQHDLHVGPLDLGPYGGDLRSADRFQGDTAERRLAPQRFAVPEQEGPRPIIQQPLHCLAALERPVGQPVRTEVVGLLAVHGHQQVLRR